MATGVYPYALGDGSVRYYVKYRTSNGVARTRRGFRSERQATRWRTQTLAAVYRGEVVAVRGSFAERFDAWLEEHRPRIEPGTYADGRTHGDRRLKPFFGAMKPAAITATDVRRYVAALVREGDLSAKTINNSLAVLRVFFAHLEEDGDVIRNPARSSPGARERIKLPAAHREMDYLRPGGEVDVVPRQGDGHGSTKGDRFRAVDFGARLDAVLAEVRPAGGSAGTKLVCRGPRGGELSRSDVARPAQAGRSRTRRCGAACACTTCATPPPRRGWPPGCR